MKDKNLGKNAFFNVLRTIFSIIFPLITFPYVTRTLGVAAIGSYNYSLSIISYFVLIAGLGIAAYGIREGARIHNDTIKFEKFCSQIFTINLISTIVAYIALFFLIGFIPSFFKYRNTLLILSLEVLFTTLGMNWLYSVFEKFKLMTIISIATQGIAVILMFLFVKSPNDYYRYIWISAFISIMPNFVYFLFSRKLCRIKITKDIQWRKHFKPILFLFSMTIATTVYVSLDTTMLGMMTNDYYVGYYSVSVKIYTIMKQLLNSVIWVVIPRAAMTVVNKKEFNILVKKISDFVMILVIPIVIGIFFMSKEIICLISGEEYLLASASLKILSLSIFFAVLGNLYANCVLVPLKKEKYVLKITVISAIVNFILNLILIKYFQENAAAFTTLVSEIIVFVYCRHVSIHKEKIIINVNRSIICIGIIISFLIGGICIAGKIMIENYIVRLFVCIFISLILLIGVVMLFKNTFIKLIANGE